jgi:ferredoxin
LVAIESHFDSFLFSDVEIWMRSVTTFIVALLTLGIIGVLAWRHGRTYCNTVCPVGTILSFFARFSLFRIQINEDKCRKCGLCTRNCKAAAIDFKNGTVDLSRCVACGDCIDKCHDGAISYRPLALKDRCAQRQKTADAQRPVDTSKRAFLTGAAVAVGTAAMAQAKIKVDGGLAEIEDKVAPHRDTPVTPPGSVSARNMQRHCTACQLCVSACPNNVLRPSSDPLRLMQPEMSFERGYCRPECTRCSQVCPTGAIQTIRQEDKPFIHIGHAVWIEQNCIPVANGDHCGACARHCPADAIQMVEHATADGRTVLVPAIDNERCIGCGKCEYVCPARPFSAIYVEGNSTHIVK